MNSKYLMINDLDTTVLLQYNYKFHIPCISSPVAILWEIAEILYIHLCEWPKGLHVNLMIWKYGRGYTSSFRYIELF